MANLKENEDYNREKKIKRYRMAFNAVVAIIVVGGIFLYSNSMIGQRLKNKFLSHTVGLDRKVEVYSYDGKLLKEFSGDMLVDDGKGGTISITIGKDRHTFSNATVIITEVEK